MLVTFILFAASQIFGRAVNMESAILVYQKILFEHGNLYLDITTLIFALFGLIIVLLNDANKEFFENRYSLFANRFSGVRYASYLVVLFITILFGVFSGSSFIYFQF
jgi:hypothetical protein